MIKFEDSEILQVLPECIKRDSKVISVSYAIRNAMNRLIMYSHCASVYATIDELPEKILDLLAVEMRSQYYDENMPMAIKRDIIKKTLLWYRHAGTPSAVQELIETVFGVGEVHEWFEYGGKPYRFKVITNANSSYESIDEFEKIIKKVKNTRSHLEKVEFVREQETPIYMGIANVIKINVDMGWEE